MRFIKRLRALFSSTHTNRLDELLERAGVPRTVPPELLEVARLADLRLDGDGEGEGEGEGSGEGEGEGEGEGKGSGEGEGEGEGEGGEGEGEGEGSGEGEGEGEGAAVDWKKESRKHEGRAKSLDRKLKREEKERKKLEEEGKKRKDAEKTEHEKALEKAREEGKQEASSAAEKERRKDRLEATVIRIASKGVKVGEGDDAKTLRFEDPEDAQVFLSRAMNNGEPGEDEIFSEDGKVNSSVVEEALATILEEKPRLAAETKQRPSGSADGGKGKSAAQKDLEDMSVDDHFKRIRRTK